MEPRVPYYFPVGGGRIIGFMLIPRVLMLCEMQSASSRIRTRVTEFIYYYDYPYTTGTSTCMYVCMCQFHESLIITM